MKTNLFQPSYIAAGLLLAAVPVFYSGCFGLVAGAAAGAGAVAYVRGELDVTLDHDYDSVVLAAGRAVEQLKFVKVSEQRDELSAVLVSRTAMDEKVEITLTRVSPALTKVAVRVGVFGSESVSLTVLSAIKEKL